MLHAKQIFGNAMSSIAALLLAYPAVVGAGGNLSVSPDQKTDTSQLQIQNANEGSGSSGMEATTMQVAPQQAMSVSNVGINSVDPNSSIIFEVPVQIDTGGEVTQKHLDLNDVARQGDGDDVTPNFNVGDVIENAIVQCLVILGADGYIYVKHKWISLDQNGAFDGIVKLGVPFENSQLKRGMGLDFEWKCAMRPVPGNKNDYNFKKTGLMYGAGGAYNLSVSGESEY